MGEHIEGRRAVAHLLRRAGFGPDLATWPALAERPFEAVLDELLDDLDGTLPPDPPGFDPYEPGAIQATWLERMRGGQQPLAERLAFFWHGHFATSNAKIQDARLMWMQYELLRRAGGGPFRDLVLGISRDVAMIRWLDGNANRKGHANENYARELQELFTLGIGSYTEEDIREIARAFTGWGSRHHTFVFRPEFHDDGEKTIHGQTGRFGGEEVVDLLVSLPACSRFIAGKLLRHFSHPDPTAEEVEALAAVFRETDGDIRATLRALFLADAFRTPRSHRALVKSPVEACVGALRATGAETVPAWMHASLDRMGQILFRPPSVKGWTSGTGWLSSGALVERLTTARDVAGMADPSAEEAVLDVLFADHVSDRLAAALDGAEDGRARMAVALASPEYQLA